MTIIVLLALTNAKAQNYSDQAKTYFSKCSSSNSVVEIIVKSFPTLDDCKLVFKGDNAYTYFGKLEDIKSQIGSGVQRENQVFVENRVQVFSTQDIELGKGNYAGGMKSIVDKLQPYVTFYEITFLKVKGAEAGNSYKYWVNINGRWVFFPKPFDAFGN